MGGKWEVHGVGGDGTGRLGDAVRKNTRVSVKAQEVTRRLKSRESKDLS
jgi:hypothetical protein